MRLTVWATLCLLACWACADSSADEYPPIMAQSQGTPELREWQTKLDAMSAAELVDMLAFPQTTEQVQATLRKRGHGVAPQLIAALKRRDEFVSRGAAQLLGDLREQSAVPALIEFAKRNKKTLAAAARALSAIGGQEAADFLLEQLPKTEPGKEEPFIRGLMKIGDVRAVEPLAAVLADFKRPVFSRCLAVESLTRFCDPRARSALEKAVVDDPDWRVYYQAKCALEKICATTETLPMARRATYRKLVEKMCKRPTPPESQIAFVADDRLPQAEISRAEEDLLAAGKGGDAETVTEELLQLFVGGKVSTDVRERGKKIIAKIGPAAEPALRNGAKREPTELSRACQECLGRK